jgi:RNA polymerase-binding transcription factor DksA
MATQRKPAARGKATTSRKQTAASRPARAGAKAAHGSKPKARAVVATRPAPRAAAKPSAAKPSTAKVIAAKTAGRVAKVVGRPAVKGKPKLAVARRTPDPTVRPLGVLPPERQVRSVDRAPLPVAARVPARASREPQKSPSVQRVTEKDYKEFEDLLLVERQKIMKEMGHLETTVLKVNQRESAGDLSRYSFHMADAGTDAMEREKSFLLASAEGRILMEINEALRRLYRSEFGSCEICGQPIGRARLEAMPYTRLCLSCKEKEERASRGAL